MLQVMCLFRNKFDGFNFLVVSQKTYSLHKSQRFINFSHYKIKSLYKQNVPQFIEHISSSHKFRVISQRTSRFHPVLSNVFFLA